METGFTPLISLLDSVVTGIADVLLMVVLSHIVGTTLTLIAATSVTVYVFATSSEDDRMRLLSAFLIGLMLGLGIVISSMVNPAKALSCSDIAGTWDPSLAFVMGGALIITMIGYRFALRHPGPILGDSFRLQSGTRIDARFISNTQLRPSTPTSSQQA